LCPGPARARLRLVVMRAGARPCLEQATCTRMLCVDGGLLETVQFNKHNAGPDEPTQRKWTGGSRVLQCKCCRDDRESAITMNALTRRVRRREARFELFNRHTFRDNQTMNSLHWPRKLAAAAVLGVVALAQTPRPGESSLELEPSLFVQLPGGKSTPGAVQLVWIPQPLEKYCLGKTHEQCASMDFCIRTTTKNVSTWRNLAVMSRAHPRTGSNISSSWRGSRPK
jgi:hypothetical protein